jgi:hypothetical protein
MIGRFVKSWWSGWPAVFWFVSFIWWMGILRHDVVRHRWISSGWDLAFLALAFYWAAKSVERYDKKHQ